MKMSTLNLIAAMFFLLLAFPGFYAGLLLATQYATILLLPVPVVACILLSGYFAHQAEHFMSVND